MFDPHRPRSQPAQLLYDAIVKEAAKRKGIDSEVWILRERMNVWQIARDYAQQHGLPVPTIEQVERAENSACGHVDYASKWAHGVSDLMRQQ